MYLLLLFEYLIVNTPNQFIDEEKQEHKTFGERNPIEQWFGILKQRIKRFYEKQLHNASTDGENINQHLQIFLLSPGQKLYYLLFGLTHIHLEKEEGT